MRRNWLVDDGWLLPAWLCSVAADDGGDDDGDGGGSRGDDGGSRSDDGGPGGKSADDGGPDGMRHWHPGI